CVLRSVAALLSQHRGRWMSPPTVFGLKTVVVFALPGAFTPDLLFHHVLAPLQSIGAGFKRRSG
ncbi:hypothetical protein, partial [endosymbiont of Lamellibrachia barhami]|uniref:hypothetical protein n=1 Tax=endosymbiont of Lamellibrachia barhami TaxID=205975 RepID=UPI00272D8C09